MTAVVTATGQTRSVRRRPRRLGATLVALFLFVLVAVAVIGPLVAPHSANATNLALGLHGPTSGYVLGTDSLGHDVLSRVLTGARSTIIGPTLIALGAMVLSNILGLIAGYRGGRVDAVISRCVDVMMSLPSFLVTVVVVGVVGGGYCIAVALLVVLAVPYNVRVVRGATLEQRTRPYVEASHALGLGPWRIMASQIWPNVVPIVIANAFLDFAFSLVNLSGLSYLGLGSPPGSADWGRMLADNQSLLLGNAWASLAPGLIIVITAVGMNLVGDWLSEALLGRGGGH